MRSDEELDRRCAVVETTLGPTRSGWYREACSLQVEDTAAEVLWACRAREVIAEYTDLLVLARAWADADDAAKAAHGENATVAAILAANAALVRLKEAIRRAT